MFRKLWLFLGLIASLGAPVFAADESKGSVAGAAAGDSIGLGKFTVRHLINISMPDVVKVWFLAGTELDIKTDQYLYLPKSFLERFERLQLLLESDYAGSKKELHLPSSVVSYQDLKNLHEMIAVQKNFRDFDFVRVARLVNLAYELGANQQTKELLSLVLNWLRQEIKKIASPELAAQIKSLDASIKLPLIIDDFKSKTFVADIEKMIWQPDGSNYWVIKFVNYKLIAQKYNAAGVSQGRPLLNVRDIVYSPDGSNYWVISDRTLIYTVDRLREEVYIAQRYNAAGVAQGAPLRDGVDNIIYSPDGSSYWAKYGFAKRYRSQRYNAAGVAQGEPLWNVGAIVYSPDGSDYWVVFWSGRAQRYNAAGVAYPEFLSGIANIVYSPNGSYWVIGYGAQKHNAAGVAQGAPLRDGVHDIVYSPDGSNYWVIFMDRRAQRYNAEGQVQGDPLYAVDNIVYSPDGGCWVSFSRKSIVERDFHSDQINNITRRYSNFRNLPLYQQVMVQWVINQFEASGNMPINLSYQQIDILSLPVSGPKGKKDLRAINELKQLGYIKDNIIERAFTSLFAYLFSSN